MNGPLKWGILGTGGIATKFATQLASTDRGQLVAVGSRQIESAQAFTQQHGGQAFGSYSDVLQQPDVDVVYISLPNSLHHSWSIQTMQSGKHVLCEKPIAANTAEAEEMYDVAKKTGQVLFEAFMYRCQPVVQEILQRVHSGELGQPRIIRSNFTFQRQENPADVRYQPSLAGGSLMDVGCYCINFARALTREEPTNVHLCSHRHETGIDDYSVGTLEFPSGTLCTFTCGMNVQADRTTVIGGEKGFLRVEMPWFSGGGEYEVVRQFTDVEAHVAPNPNELLPYALEAEAVADCLQGATAPFITPEDSLGNMRVLDRLKQSRGW